MYCQLRACLPAPNFPISWKCFHWEEFREVHHTLLSLSILLNKTNHPINPAYVNVSNVLLLAVIIVTAQIGTSTSSADLYLFWCWFCLFKSISNDPSLRINSSPSGKMFNTSIVRQCHQYAVSDRGDLYCADGHFYKVLRPIYISMSILQLNSILVMPIFTQFL